MPRPREVGGRGVVGWVGRSCTLIEDGRGGAILLVIHTGLVLHTQQFGCLLAGKAAFL